MSFIQSPLPNLPFLPSFSAPLNPNPKRNNPPKKTYVYSTQVLGYFGFFFFLFFEFLNSNLAGREETL